MRKRNLKRLSKSSWSGAVLVIAVFIAIVIIGFIIYNHTGYREFTNGNTQSEVQALNHEYDHENKLEYTYAYRAGCKHCENMASTTVPLMRNLKRHHQNLVVINVKNPSVAPSLLHNNISQVPAIRVTYHGKLIYQYEGYRKRYFKKIMHGIDPITRRKFSKHVTPYGITRNDIMHSISKQPNSNS